MPTQPCPEDTLSHVLGWLMASAPGVLPHKSQCTALPSFCLFFQVIPSVIPVQMKAISFHGPWAQYETRLAEQASRIDALGGEVAHWRGIADEARLALAASQSERAEEARKSAEVLDENVRARSMIQQLRQEVDSVSSTGQSASKAMEEQLSAVNSELQRLGADNLLLKNELAKNVQVGRTACGREACSFRNPDQLVCFGLVRCAAALTVSWTRRGEGWGSQRQKPRSLSR